MNGQTGRAGQTVLGIDTSAHVAAGVARGGEVLASGTIDDSRAHAERLMPLITEVCARAGVGLDDLDLVAVGLGPGPFTGLRVGIATARTLASVLRIGLHGVCSLDILAGQVVTSQIGAGASGPAGTTRPDGEFVVAGDARRQEVYWARYDASGRRIDGPFVGPAAALPELAVFGPGGTLYADVLGARVHGGPQTIDAGWLAARASDLPGAGVEPLYLRRPDATVPTRRKSTLVVPRPRQRDSHERRPS